MLEPHVLIALQEFYQREFGVSETPPSPDDKSVVTVQYASHYLLFDYVPGMNLPKVNPKAIASIVNRLRKEEGAAVNLEITENTFAKIFDELKSTYGDYASFAYAEILSGSPCVFFENESEIIEWKNRLKG